MLISLISTIGYLLIAAVISQLIIFGFSALIRLFSFLMFLKKWQACRVIQCDDQAVRIMNRDKIIASMAWTNVAAIVIITTDKGPFTPDVFWCLQTIHEDGTLIVPSETEGIADFVNSLARHFTDIDSIAINDAMVSTRSARFQVWPAVKADP